MINSTNAVNRFCTLSLGIVLTLTAIPGAAQDWIEYINRQERFMINFPGEPEVSETTHVSAFEVEYPGKIFSANTQRGDYSVTVIDYTEHVRRHRERTDGTEANSSNAVPIMDVRASVAHAANMYRTRGGEVTYDGWVDVEKIDGHQLQITNPDQSRSFIAIFQQDARLYILEATVPRGYPPPVLFQSSLGFLDEQGRRIRYVVDVNGQRERIDVRNQWIGADPDSTAEQVVVE
jgi:hypothetical protein